jgi:lysophospholipase L1-like esterase
MKKFFKYSILITLLAFTTLILIEIVFRLLIFRPESDMQRIYETIINPKIKMPYSAQPYLNYINTPYLKDKDDNLEVNSMGIRYPREIDLKKTEGTLRILFLGGSSTFGDVDTDYDAFPAMVEKRLKSSFLPQQHKYKEIECLNGGVHGLTSAEILNHFQFKYQYLEPDLVVLHTGVNDAFTYAKIHNATYQPDYHNIRRVFYDVNLPTNFERKLLKSKAFAYIFFNIRLKDFMRNDLEDNIFFFHCNDKLWFKPGNDAITDTTYNAFYNNLKTLYAITSTRKVDLMIVPEVIDTTKMFPPELRRKIFNGLKINKQMMQQLSLSFPQIMLRELPEEEFNPSHFEETDGIHTNESGELLKSKHISNFIIEALNSKH